MYNVQFVEWSEKCHWNCMVSLKRKMHVTKIVKWQVWEKLNKHFRQLLKQLLFHKKNSTRLKVEMILHKEFSPIVLFFLYPASSDFAIYDTRKRIWIWKLIARQNCSEMPQSCWVLFLSSMSTYLKLFKMGKDGNTKWFLIQIA